MFVLHSDGMGITNIDNVNRLCLNGRYITAYMNDGSSHYVGVYNTADFAKIMFEQIWKELEERNCTDT